MRLLIYLLAFFSCYVCFGGIISDDDDHVYKGSVLLGVKSVGSVADTSSALEIISTTEGFLPPRMTEVQRDAISSPATGLLLYNTDESEAQNYTGSAWSSLGGGADASLFLAMNLITSNADFEDGDATGWTSSGTPTTYEVQGVTVGNGSYSLSYDPDADGEYAETDAYTVPDAFKSRNGVACVRYKGADSNLEINIIDGSANELASEALSASADWTDVCINFIYPSSGTVKLRFEAEGDAAAGYFDDVFLGDANRVNISKVSSATFYGSAKWVGVADCGWTGSSATWDSYAVDNDCITPAGVNLKENAEAPATKIPAIKFTNLPPGKYFLIAKGYFYLYEASGTTVAGYYRFHDGTTGSASNTAKSQGTSGSVYLVLPVISGEFVYTTTQSSVTFEIQYAKVSGDGVGVFATEADYRELEISVYRFPLSSETAYTPGQVSLAWSGYHSANCNWTETNTVYDDPAGDGTCDGLVELVNKNFGTVTTVSDGTGEQPQIQWTPKSTGIYEVCTTGNIANGTQHEINYIALTDGSDNVLDETLGRGRGSTNEYMPFRLCGYFNVTNLSQQTSKLRIKVSGGTAGLNSTTISTWSIKNITHGLNIPAFLNMVESSASGGDILCRAKLNCDAASAITSQSGSCVASIGNIAAGVCVVTLTTGTYGATAQCSCDLAGSTLDEDSRADATSVTNINLYGIKPTTGAALTSFDCDLICTGDK